MVVVDMHVPNVVNIYQVVFSSPLSTDDIQKLRKNSSLSNKGVYLLHRKSATPNAKQHLVVRCLI